MIFSFARAIINVRIWNALKGKYMKYTKKEIFSIPNLMGYLRILLIPLFVFLYLQADSTASYLVAGAIVGFSAVLDFFDGYVARHFHMVTDIGKMIDPIADKLTQAAVALCLAARYPLMVPLLILMLVKELYMAIRGVMKIARSGKVHGAAFRGKVCTASLFVTFGALVLIPDMPLLIANLLILVSMLIMLVTLVLYMRDFGGGDKKRGVCCYIRNFVLFLLTAFCIELLALLGFAVSPFVIYKDVSPATMADFDVQALFDDRTSGARVKLLTKNSDALDERIRLMQMAKKRIVISTFDIREGTSFRDMAAVMLERANAGVEILVLGDAFSVELHMAGNPLIDALTSHPNIEMRLYNRIDALEPHKSQGRMHDKYVIVDDFAYIIGGRNTFDYFLTDDTDKGSYDCELLIYESEPSENSSLALLDDYFDSVYQLSCTVKYREDASLAERQDVQAEIASLEARYQRLREEKPQLFGEQDLESMTYQTTGVALLANPIHIYGKEPILFYKMTELMKSAKERVTIHTPYAVLNDYMYRSLQEVVDAVPNVSMMLNGIENGDNIVASSDYIYHKKRLLDTDIRLLEYQGGTSYHGKSVLIDRDISIVGSFNFDLRSAYIDTELMLVVRSEELNRELSASFDSYEASACLQLKDGGQIVPSHVKIEPLSLGKSILYHFLGLVLQPFRFLA